MGAWVEDDAQWADTNRTDTATVGPAIFSLEQRFENFGAFRGRLGYAFNNVAALWHGRLGLS